MAKLPKNHYSPVFANKAWANEEGYVSYFSCQHTKTVIKKPKGKRQWGYKQGLYASEVEKALNEELENIVAPIYQKILSINELNTEERIIWAQFLLSQLVRTPTFMKYEKHVRKVFNINDGPKHDRVGCRECGDLFFVANRDWCLLLSHDDDYFVRTDNPVLQTGFIERPETCLFYPLNPRLCFVACSMKPEWNAFSYIPNETQGYKLEKGGAHFIDFYLAKAAGETLIISPQHEGYIAETMFSEILGLYPQPPFSLHTPNTNEVEDAYKSIQSLMSEVDKVNYPSWQPFELEPYYQLRQ